MNNPITADRFTIAYLVRQCKASVALAFGLLITAGASIYFLHQQFPVPTSGASPGYSHPIEARLLDWSDTRLQRRPQEGDFEFVSRLNDVVFRSFFHCEPDDRARPIDDLAWQLLSLLPTRYLEHGLLYPKSIRCGFCHQAAYMVSRAATRAGVQVLPWSLNGHVVALAYIDENIYIFDPDLGVGPIDYIQYDKLKIRDSYNKHSGWNDALEAAFKEVDDDRVYTEMRKLIKRENLHRSVVVLLESLSLAFLVGAAIHLMSILISGKGKKFGAAQLD